MRNGVRALALVTFLSLLGFVTWAADRKPPPAQASAPKDAGISPVDGGAASAEPDGGSPPLRYLPATKSGMPIRN